jgi:hypothetical protein
MKNTRGTYIVVLGICILLITPLVIANQQKPQTTNAVSGTTSQPYIEDTVAFSVDELTFSRFQGYDLITFSPGEYLTEYGKPMLPMKTIYLALPSGMKATDLVIESTTSIVLDGRYVVYPTQPPQDLEEIDTGITNLEVDSTCYTSLAPYPSEIAHLIGQSDLAGQGIAEIQLYPVQYHPLFKILEVLTSITFRVNGAEGYICGDYLPLKLSEKGRADYTKMIAGIVDNDAQIQMTTQQKIMTTALPSGGPYDHVIITSQMFAPYFEPLVVWHTKKGVPDTVVTTEYIYSTYDGDDNPEKIRNFIIDAYSTWGTYYFLIGGEDEIVPFEYRTYYEDSTPSYQYYSDFDDDWIQEVSVGRISVDNATQINLFINKLIMYEKNPPLTNYVENVLLIGMDLFENTRGADLKDTIDSYIPAQFDVTKVYDIYPTNHRVSVLNALNAGQHLVNHADHGQWNKIGVGDRNHGWRITNYDIDELTNTNKLSIFVTLACLPNKMDAEDCFGEHFVIYNEMQAGIAFVGNTRNGWGYIGYPEELSGRLDREWWSGLFEEDIYNLGQVLNYAKHQFPTADPDSDVKQHCEWEFSLLGEPEMPIWTANPQSLSVTYPETLPMGLSEFPVHVTSQGAPLEEAYVCVYKNDEIYERGYTSSTGDISFELSPFSSGYVSVTVTKHNYLPEESEAIVIPGPTYPYVPNTPIPADDAEHVMDFNIDLGWAGGDPQNDPVTYAVYFGTTSPPPLVISDISQTVYDPGTLSCGTTYYWRIVADDNNGSITYGPIWTFTMIAENYIQVESTSALLGQTGKRVDINGVWNEPIKAYQVYLSFDPTKLTFWKIEFTGTIGENADYALGNEMEPGMLSFGAVWFVEGYPDAGSGLLAHLFFNVTASNIGDIALDFTPYNGNPYVFSDENGFSIYPDGIDGTLTIVSDAPLCGDANGDGIVNVSDAVFIINYVFVPGFPAPSPLCAGDANGDGIVNVSDAVFIINYVFVPGFPPPLESCCGT